MANPFVYTELNAVDVREVTGHGHMSVLRDPGGATIALWEAKKA